MDDDRLPAALQPLCADYLTVLDQSLPGFVGGCVIHGSVALGAFDPTWSDLDLLVILQRPWTPADLPVLRQAHALMTHHYPRWPLEVSYLQPADIGRCTGVLLPHPHYHDGRLTIVEQANTADVIWWVTWWIISHHGLVLRDPSPIQSIAIADWTGMDDAMRANLQAYWGRFLTRPTRMAWLLADYGVQWVVLGVLRQSYTLRTGTITTKAGAGEAALTVLPPRWHRIIQEALRVRRQSSPHSLYGSRIQRAWDTHALLASIITAHRAPR